MTVMETALKTATAWVDTVKTVALFRQQRQQLLARVLGEVIKMSQKKKQIVAAAAMVATCTFLLTSVSGVMLVWVCLITKQPEGILELKNGTGLPGNGILLQKRIYKWIIKTLLSPSCVSIL